MTIIRTIKKAGVLSDTHEDERGLKLVVNELIKEGADIIFHCGDIDERHLKTELFGNLPVAVALTEEQYKGYVIKEKTNKEKVSSDDYFNFASQCLHKFYEALIKDNLFRSEEAIEILVHSNLNKTLDYSLSDFINKAVETKEKIKTIHSPSPDWHFTHPGNKNRIVSLEKYGLFLVIYLGHKRSFDVLFGSVKQLLDKIEELQLEFDRVRIILSGHTHHQAFFQGSKTPFGNPGAVKESLGIAGGLEYLIIDFENKKFIFKRIPEAKSMKQTLNLALIYDSMEIDKKDKNFWKKLEKEFKENQVTHIIHCGNFIPEELFREELKSFKMFFYLKNEKNYQKNLPSDWLPIPKNNILEIENYYFKFSPDLEKDIEEKSEKDMKDTIKKINNEDQRIETIIFCSNNAFYEELEEAIIISPGSIYKRRDYCILKLPDFDITFGVMPFDPI